MAEHDLSALSGLLGELDIVERGPGDPRAAKLAALFQKAKQTYTAKIDTPNWYIASSSSSTTPFDIHAFEVPSPTTLLAQRKSDRTGTTTQEWTANHLFTSGHFEVCLSYVASFALSMGIDFDFDEKKGVTDLDSTQLALRRSKEERDVSKNWGVVKDVVDVGIRALLSLLRSHPSPSLSTLIDAWVPASEGFTAGKTSLQALGKVFLSFAMREIRVGAGDTRAGYSGMVISPTTPSSSQPRVDMDKVALQNWTVTHGLALTAGDLALELGLYRTATEAHTLFLACRGQMWRVLLALAHELASYHQLLAEQGTATTVALQALKTVSKAATVSALQAVPRPRRIELAHSVIGEHRVIPADWIEETEAQTTFEDEDALLFDGLLQPVKDRSGWLVVPEEIGIAMVKVIFAKKSGLLAVAGKFPTYMREYKQRLAGMSISNSTAELDVADEDDTTATGLRSVRTL